MLRGETIVKNPEPKSKQAHDMDRVADRGPSNAVMQPVRDFIVEAQLVIGETSNVNQHSKALVVNNMSTNFVDKPSIEEDGSSKSEYIDATQLVEVVPETRIDESQRKQITDFLQDSWANMVDANNLDDNGVNLLQDKDFQLVTSKRRKGKKSLQLGKTRLVSSQQNMSQGIVFS